MKTARKRQFAQWGRTQNILRAWGVMCGFFLVCGGTYAAMNSNGFGAMLGVAFAAIGVSVIFDK